MCTFCSKHLFKGRESLKASICHLSLHNPCNWKTIHAIDGGMNLQTNLKLCPATPNLSFSLLAIFVNCFYKFGPHSGELRMQTLKSHLMRTQSLHVLPLKPGVGQYIAIHATLTARDFFLADFYPSSLLSCIFSKTSPKFFLC